MSDKSNVARLPPGKPPAMADIDFPTLITTVLERGLDPAVIQSVLQMYNDHQDRRHQEALNAAVADVCAEILPVLKDAENRHLGNRYASHQGIMQMLTPFLKTYGVRVGFDVGALPGEHPVEPGYVRVRIVIGYGPYCERSSYIDEPITQAGSQGGRTQMTQNQALTSATTYAQRTLLRLKFNISYTDEDDDGEGGRNKTDTGTKTETKTDTKMEANAKAATTDAATRFSGIAKSVAKASTLADVAALERHEKVREIRARQEPHDQALIDSLFAARRAELAASAPQDLPDDFELETTPPGEPSELLTRVLARIASCLTTVALDSCAVAPEFTTDVARLNTQEGERATEAMKARYRELEAK
jgi:hypothetical protein